MCPRRVRGAEGAPKCRVFEGGKDELTLCQRPGRFLEFHWVENLRTPQSSAAASETRGQRESACGGG
eukprot:scaffold42820_cov54-Phaeocystis_antarctica.AAC.2